MANKRVLTYSKSSGTRELSEGRESRKPLPVEVTATASLPSVKVPSGYRKDDGVLRLHDRMVQLETVDKIYMFTDVDHYEEELRDILSNRMPYVSPIWIISNPDFEIWLYYCFRNNPDIDLADVVEVVPSQRSSKLKEVNGTFNKGGGLDTRKAFEHLKDGIVHSKEHYQQDEYGVPVLFSTQMHLFAEDVLAELGNEYDEWMKARKAKDGKYGEDGSESF